MNLLFYPNKALETKCLPVTEFNEDLNVLLDGMKLVMLNHNGLGLSANQVGVLLRVMVIKTNKGEIYELVNPKLIETDGEISLSEGCLSAPGIYIDIIRPTAVLIEYQDRSGEVKRVMAEGIESRCFMHELDHLNGIFYFSKVNRQVRKVVQSKLKKILLKK